jgi:hypothetical protein
MPVREPPLLGTSHFRIVKHMSGPFNARASDVAMEEITLAYERLELD